MSDERDKLSQNDELEENEDVELHVLGGDDRSVLGDEERDKHGGDRNLLGGDRDS